MYLELPKLKTGMKEAINEQGMLEILVKDMQIQARFDIVQNLAGNFLVESMIFNIFIRGSFPKARKIIPEHSVTFFHWGRVLKSK